ncbi:hypothetical protein, variant [Sphaeroforma arctica JP610]|uniref:Galactokinase n=1 Tax=Sphaeroforma arctica JP610 TaxID=667725 RepID=A0A0L0GFS5_9EUKA|nr:hypothetical protein, variant [Sphaeroforma arctica JP610]KNC87867.1 hypothetical protein, variant [Sphaeroforma arctica JP610]|eukprot:XP_014161770.1 hypothetical protein, variant [Sphaeroforma arctica JP610]
MPTSLKNVLTSITEQLVKGGMTSGAAQDKAPLFKKAATLLQEDGASEDCEVNAYWVPGRIEVVGKHTDYCGGRSLLAAVSKGFAVVTRDRDDDIVKIITTFASGEKKVAEVRMHRDLDPAEGESWVNYPATTVRRMVRNFGINKGIEIAIGCDLPEASGMSTSSAVICYMFMTLSARNNIEENETFKKHLPTTEELYSYLGFIENGQNCNELAGDKGVGTFGGSEDHTGIMSGQAMKLNMFSYCPTAHEGAFSFPEEVTFVICVSGCIAEKTGAKMGDYNNAAFLARDGAKAWSKATGKSAANYKEVIVHTKEGGSTGVKESILDQIAKFDDGKHYPEDADRKYPAGALTRRFDQFYEENEVIVPGVAKAFAEADYTRLAELTDKSQQLTDTGLMNLVPETRALPKLARENGALASSAFGAGFGGSVWALVKKSEEEKFTKAWADAYYQEFPEVKGRATFFDMVPGM